MNKSTEKHCRERLGTSIVKAEEAIEPNEYRKCKSQVRENEWKRKPMLKQLGSDKEGVSWEQSWQWIVKGDLKGCTKALLCIA